MAVKDYDVAAAFQAIEYELINSFFRNMKKHTVDEVTEQKEWEMWQVKQLQELAEYKKHNEKKYGTKFTRINKTIKEMIRLSNEQGQMDQEAQILDAIDKGLKPKRANEAMTGQFFVTNERKLDTLINATVSDMERAEVAVLRKANDVYRKTIFNAMVYANTGAGTYEKAVDMATKDFMKAGLTCIEYKNGSKHTISDYADMAIRTANKRAYLQGEGAKRQEWGVHTVIVNKRLAACPHCMPFAGKVFIDDVWGGGTAADGDYPLLSTAIEAGLYHPRCKDSHTAFFPGISDNPKRYTKKEIKEAEEAEKLEAKENLAKRQAESQQRVANTRLDPENKRVEQARVDKWKYIKDRINGTIEASASKMRPKFNHYKPDAKTRQEIIKRGIEEKRPIFADDLLGKLAYELPPKEGWYDVVLHGWPNHLEFFGQDIDVETLCAIIAQRKDYKKGTPIRLISCYTGKIKDGVAQYVSNKLNVDVEAPDKKGIINKNIYGEYSVYSGSKIGKHDGEMVPFHPQRTKVIRNEEGTSRVYY